jgi:Flp pilus assembly protein TadG
MRKTAFTLALKTSARELRLRIGDLLASTQGMATVELAMCLPAMLLMYLGMTEATVGVNIDRKLTLLSRSLADLTARASTVNSTDIGNILSAASSVMAPYPTSDLTMVVSSIAVTGSGSDLVGKVCWSEAQQGSARALGSTFAIPDGFKTAGTSFIVAEAKVPYKPVFGYAFTGTITLGQTTPWPVRNVAEVPYSGVKTFKDTELGRSATGKCLS